MPKQQDLLKNIITIREDTATIKEHLKHLNGTIVEHAEKIEKNEASRQKS